MRKFSTSFTSFYHASKPVAMFGGNVTQCYPNYGNVTQCYNVIPEGLGEDLKLEDDKIYEEELWMAFVR